MKEDSAVNRLIASAGVVALTSLLGWTSYQIVSRNAADAFAECRDDEKLWDATVADGLDSLN